MKKTPWLAIIGTVAYTAQLFILHPKQYGNLDLLKTILSLVAVIILFYYALQFCRWLGRLDERYDVQDRNGPPIS